MLLFTRLTPHVPMLLMSCRRCFSPASAWAPIRSGVLTATLGVERGDAGISFGMVNTATGSRPLTALLSTNSASAAASFATAHARCQRRECRVDPRHSVLSCCCAVGIGLTGAARWLSTAQRKARCLKPNTQRPQSRPSRPPERRTWPPRANTPRMPPRSRKTPGFPRGPDLARGEALASRAKQATPTLVGRRAAACAAARPPRPLPQ